MRSLGKICLALALVVALGAASTASAAVTAWWEFVSSPTGNVSLAGGQGAAGTTLQLTKGAGPGTFTFDAIMKFSVTGTDNVSGHHNALYRDADLSINLDAAAGAIGWFIQAAPTGLNSGGFLTSGVGEAAFPIAGDQPIGAGQTVTALTATFTITKSAATPGAVHNIFQAVGPLKWANSPSGSPMVAFGPNSPVSGAVSGDAVHSTTPLPVITITNVPEPATLALLGLGLVGLVRRRR